MITTTNNISIMALGRQLTAKTARVIGRDGADWIIRDKDALVHRVAVEARPSWDRHYRTIRPAPRGRKRACERGEAISLYLPASAVRALPTGRQARVAAILAALAAHNQGRV